MLQEGIYTLLAADAGVQGAVGVPRQDSTTGIFFGMMPEGTPLPVVVYESIHEEDLLTMEGPDTFTQGRMAFSCYAGSALAAKQLARAVRQALEDFQGALTDGTEIDGMHRISEIDRFEDAPFSYMTVVDFEIQFRDLSA